MESNTKEGDVVTDEVESETQSEIEEEQEVRATARRVVKLLEMIDNENGPYESDDD